jgi:hypothetical protein
MMRRRHSGASRSDEPGTHDWVRPVAFGLAFGVPK